MSRFGLDPKALMGGVRAAREAARPPVCRPCSENVPDHGRCPTVLSVYLGVIQSDYACPCYYDDIPGHEEAADERQAIYESDRDFDTTQTMSYPAAARREYQNWAEEL